MLRLEIGGPSHPEVHVRLTAGGETLKVEPQAANHASCGRVINALATGREEYAIDGHLSEFIANDKRSLNFHFAV